MKPPKQGGTQANYTGTVLEKFIQARLDELEYTYIVPAKFDAARYLEQPVYSRQYHVGDSIYNTPLYCDFILYHPTRWPNSLIIESKWQQVSGSVDEKYPFLVLNIQYHYPHETILLLDGGAIRPVLRFGYAAKQVMAT